MSSRRPRCPVAVAEDASTLRLDAACGRTPDGDPNAYDAREIVANVGPYLKLPPA